MVKNSEKIKKKLTRDIGSTISPSKSPENCVGHLLSSTGRIVGAPSIPTVMINMKKTVNIIMDC